MSVLFMGFLLVVVSAAAFGYALFGRRPVPQIATEGAWNPREAADGGGAAETPPSTTTAQPRLQGGAVTAARVPGVDGPVLIRAPEEPARVAAGAARIPAGARLRATVLLAVGTVGTAILLGAVLSIIVVGAVLLVA